MRKRHQNFSFSPLNLNKEEVMWRHSEICCCSVAKACPILCDPMDCMQHARLPCPSLSPGVFSDSCPLSQWCHPTSYPLSPPSPLALNLSQHHIFPMTWLFISGGQSIGTSASEAVLQMNIQDWFSLGLTGLISLLSKGHSRVFSSTTTQKHQFFGAQLSLWSNFHIHTWLLEKP